MVVKKTNTLQTGAEEGRPAVMEVVDPRRPPGPQTLKRPLSKVGETPHTPNIPSSYVSQI